MGRKPTCTSIASSTNCLSNRRVHTRPGSKVLILLALGVSASSRAAGISDEVSMNNSASTPGNPRSGSVYNSIDATFDLGDSWTFGVAGDLSPKSTQRSGTQLNITNATGAETSANALLRATSSSSAIQLSAGYDSAGESSVEWSLVAGIGLTRFDTDQRVVALQESNGNVATTDAILRYCQTHTCSKALLQLIGPKPAARLESGKLSLGGTLTFLQDTDVTISGDYYAYRQDPSQVGYFSLGSTGRMQIAGGSGVPIAPLRYLVRPELAQRIGDFSLRLWVQAGRYVEGAGQTTRGAGARLQYKLTKAFKMWATASGQRDVDSEGSMSISTTFSLGLGYKF